MKKMKKTIKYPTSANPLPFYINVGKNEDFFAKLQWLLFTKFGIKRNIPCGRTEKDKYLCCCQPLTKEYIYLNKDKTKAYCKCCGSLRIMSNCKINFDNLLDY